MTNPTPGGGGRRDPAVQVRDELATELDRIVGEDSPDYWPSTEPWVERLMPAIRRFAAAEQRRVRVVLASEGDCTCANCVAEAIEEAGND